MELKDTIEMMNSSQYVDRFRAEYHQLKIRRDKLKDMLVKYKNDELNFTPKCSYDLLYFQLVCMNEYMNVLEERAKIENIIL